MLNVMRQANRRKWFLSLMIVPIVASFVIAIFAVWGGAGSTGTTGSSNDWVARINGYTITRRDFERHRQLVEGQYRQQFGDQYEQVRESFKGMINQAALSQLMGQTLAYSEAVKMGLKATPSEVADAIVNAPAFHRNGVFVGREEYIAELGSRGYDVAEYEEAVARDLTADKLRTFMGTLASVSDADVEKAYVEDGENAEVDYVVLKPADFPAAGEPADREIESYYRAHQSDYMTPEKRRARFALIDRGSLSTSVDVPDADIVAEYEKNKDTIYKGSEERRASHVLFKTAPTATQPEIDAARGKAEAILARARAGEDFAELARQNSEDSSAAAGGDLGWFGKGRMVPEFDQATWALSEGQISEVIKTQFGFHVIKLTGSRPEGVRPLDDEIRGQIRQRLAGAKTQEMLQQKADELSRKLGDQTQSFEATVSQAGYNVMDTGLFGKADPVGTLGRSPQLSDEIFRLKPGEVSGAVSISQGVVFARVEEIKAPEASPLATVRERVKLDMAASRSRDKARAAASELIKAGSDQFKATADKKKWEVKSTGEFTRKSAPPAFNDDVKKAIFAARGGEVLGPLDGPDGIVAVRMIKRGPEPGDVAAVKGRLRSSLISSRRDDAFGAFLQQAFRNADHTENNELLAELAGAPR